MDIDSVDNACDLFKCFSISGYVTDILDDAKVYSNHANKKNIDAEDVKLALQCRLDHSFTTPPPRDVSPYIACLCKFQFKCLKTNVDKQKYVN